MCSGFYDSYGTSWLYIVHNYYYYYYFMTKRTTLNEPTNIHYIDVRTEIVYAIKRFMCVSAPVCGCGYVKQTNEIIMKKKKKTRGKKTIYIFVRVSHIVKRTKATIKRTHQASIERIETRITYVVCL